MGKGHAQWGFEGGRRSGAISEVDTFDNFDFDFYRLIFDY
jgi:hypothetical protein